MVRFFLGIFWCFLIFSLFQCFLRLLHFSSFSLSPLRRGASSQPSPPFSVIFSLFFFSLNLRKTKMKTVCYDSTRFFPLLSFSDASFCSFLHFVLFLSYFVSFFNSFFFLFCLFLRFPFFLFSLKHLLLMLFFLFQIEPFSLSRFFFQLPFFSLTKLNLRSG